MNVDEFLLQAWHAVEAAGVPEPLQETAFQEALAFLRDEATGKSGSGRVQKRREDKPKDEDGNGDHADHDDANSDDFWGRLAHESGLPVSDLTDILQLSGDKVLVAPPTRQLGRNVAEQARTVIALVASARGIGLGEKPVNVNAVREELERKRCYQSSNFAAKHLGPLKGFNAGATRSEIVLTSKWADEFEAAVKAVHGSPGGE